MRIAMIGTGYVGLVSGACFAEFGLDVVCVDKDAGKIERAARTARSRSTSRASTRWSSDNVAAGRLTFTTDLAAAVDGADAVFIAVGTPIAARRRPCRPDLRLRRGRGDRRGAQATTPWSSPSRRCRSAPAAKLQQHHPRAAARRRVRRRLQSGIPARGLGDRGLHAPGPGGDRRRERARRARCMAPALPAAQPDRDADRVHHASRPPS